MILTLDVGNSQIYGGVYNQNELLIKFRKTSKGGSSSDEIGIFLRSALRENGIQPDQITQISICSVVPDVVYSLKSACNKYFNITPFVLQVGVKTGLKVLYHNPSEVGADRIANAIGALTLYPNKNLIIIDLGTATTFCAITTKKEYLGGVITPGMRISMEALETRTAKLPSVEILRPQKALGKATVESIQSGLYYGHLGMMKEISTKIINECFEGQPRPLIIGTGGFSNLFEDESFFDVTHRDLVLIGLIQALRLNPVINGDNNS